MDLVYIALKAISLIKMILARNVKVETVPNAVTIPISLEAIAHCVFLGSHTIIITIFVSHLVKTPPIILQILITIPKQIHVAHVPTIVQLAFSTIQVVKFHAIGVEITDSSRMVTVVPIALLIMITPLFIPIKHVLIAKSSLQIAQNV